MKALSHCAIFRATCLVTPLRDKLHETLQCDICCNSVIEALKEYPCLSNTSLSSYKDKSKKAEASKVLLSCINLAIEEIKKLFHSLRTSVTREVRRSMGNEAYVSKWKLFKSMEYLKDEIVKGIQNQDQSEWTDEENETLIDLYRENEFLWNHHLEDYRNRDKLAICKLKEQLTTRSSQDIKSQWHSLKTISERENKHVEGSQEVEQTPLLFQGGNPLRPLRLPSNVKIWINLYAQALTCSMDVTDQEKEAPPCKKKGFSDL